MDEHDVAEPDHGVDPRYSAVFQRGYDPARHGAGAAPLRGDPVGDRGAEAAGPSGEAAGPSEEEPIGDGMLDPPQRSLRRPALVIGSVSVLMLVAAGILFALPTPHQTSMALAFPELLREALLPALVLGGGVGVAVAAVVAALRVPGQSTEEADEP